MSFFHNFPYKNQNILSLKVFVLDPTIFLKIHCSNHSTYINDIVSQFACLRKNQFCLLLKRYLIFIQKSLIKSQFF